MKLTATTKWEYYVANVVGIVAIIGLFVWFSTIAITDTGVSLGSIYFWLALLLLILLPFTIISFFSSMKTVEVRDKGLAISYVFQKHINDIQFSEIAKMESKITSKATRTGSLFKDNFRLILVDGRVFEFGRSQFNGYDQLKSVCRRKVKGQ